MPKPSAPLRNKSSRDIVRLLCHFGFALARRGPHDVYTRDCEAVHRVVTVPRNKKSIPPKTLSRILEQASIDKPDARDFWA